MHQDANHTEQIKTLTLTDGKFFSPSFSLCSLAVSEKRSLNKGNIGIFQMDGMTTMLEIRLESRAVSGTITGRNLHATFQLHGSTWFRENDDNIYFKMLSVATILELQSTGYNTRFQLPNFSNFAKTGSLNWIFKMFKWLQWHPC